MSPVAKLEEIEGAQAREKASIDAKQAAIDKWKEVKKEIQKTRNAIIKAESSVVPLYFHLFVLLLADTSWTRGGDEYQLSQQSKYDLAGGSSFYYRARNIYKHFMKMAQKVNPTADTLTLTPQAEQLAKEYKGGLVELLKSMAGTSNREAKPLTEKQIQKRAETFVDAVGLVAAYKIISAMYEKHKKAEFDARFWQPTKPDVAPATVEADEPDEGFEEEGTTAPDATPAPDLTDLEKDDLEWAEYVKKQKETQSTDADAKASIPAPRDIGDTMPTEGAAELTKADVAAEPTDPDGDDALLDEVKKL